MAEDYEQRFAQYGNRGRGVKQAAKDRKRLMEIRKATPAPPPATTGNSVEDSMAAIAQEQANKDQAALFEKLREEGKRPGYNLGLSEDEVGYNQAVRKSIGNIRDRVGQIREKLQDSTNARQRAMLQNKIGSMNFRRQNFKRQLFTPTGANAPVLPQYDRMKIKDGEVPAPSRPFTPRPVPPKGGGRQVTAQATLRQAQVRKPKRPGSGPTGGATPR